MPPHLLFVRFPPNLPRMTVCKTRWPKLNTSCILSGLPSFRLFRCSCVFNDVFFCFYSRDSLSSCHFVWTSFVVSPRGGSASRVSPQSCQSHESLWGLCYSLAALGVTITCSICYDGVVDSRIHRGSSHILESMQSSTHRPAPFIAYVSPFPSYPIRRHYDSSPPSSSLSSSWYLKRLVLIHCHR